MPPNNSDQLRVCLANFVHSIHPGKEIEVIGTMKTSQAAVEWPQSACQVPEKAAMARVAYEGHHCFRQLYTNEALSEVRQNRFISLPESYKLQLVRSNSFSVDQGYLLAPLAI